MKTVVRVTLVFETEHEVPDDWDEDQVRFHLEENYCIGNFADDLVERLEADDAKSVCSVCSKSTAEVVSIDGKSVSS